MIIEIPGKVGKIINTLENNGFEAYAVGGCVRDAILGKKPSDWDITTSALPKEVEALFDKTFETGIKHGTITVVVEKENFEVTTFRTEEGYSDYRRPDKVNFVRNLEEDLKRRDFTINAMAYNSSRGLIDLFMGVEDLKNGVIRAVGDPYERFNEDALRMLRAVRFAARFGFEIEESTEDGINKCSALIDKISKERIREEISGILMSEHPEYISRLNELGILEYILPELAKCFKTPQNNPYHSYNVGMHIMEALKDSAADLLVRWAVMLHDVGKAYTRTTDKKGVDHFRGHDRVSEEIALRVLSEYKLDNNSKNTILLLIRHHDREILPEEKAVRRALNKLGEDLLRLLILVKRADNAGKNPEKSHKGNVALDKLENVLNGVIIKNQCTSLKDLNIKGEELIKIGIPAGPIIGKVLSNLLDKVIDNPKLNNKEILLNEAQKLISVYKK